MGLYLALIALLFRVPGSQFPDIGTDPILPNIGIVVLTLLLQLQPSKSSTERSISASPYFSLAQLPIPDSAHLSTRTWVLKHNFSNSQLMPLPRPQPGQPYASSFCWLNCWICDDRTMGISPSTFFEIPILALDYPCRWQI